MADTRLVVNDVAFQKALLHTTSEGLALATQDYQTQMKLAVNVANTGEGRPRKYVNPSKAGDPPRKRTGFGQRGIVREIDRKALVARVGVTRNALYMFYLDQGTKHISRRPFILSTLRKRRNVMIALLKSKRMK